MNPKIDELLSKNGRWVEEFRALRKIALDADAQLVEEMKWGNPTYTFNGKNVCLIHGFKAYCAFLFFKGALMDNSAGLLIAQTENVQSSRQIRFSSLSEIIELEPILTAYIQAAIVAEVSGEKVEARPTSAFPVPDEFQVKLEALPELKAAFQELTPGRQRAYLLHFTAPKQSKTRTSRIEKCLPAILAGKGLND